MRIEREIDEDIYIERDEDTCHELLPVVCDRQNGLRPR